MIPYNEALNIVTNAISSIQLKTQIISLLDSIGFALAEDIYTDINFPPFSNSAMDGIAVKYNPEVKKWKINGSIAAGKFTDISISENEAVKIMTGGKLPSDVDTVIPIEDLITEENFCQLCDSAIVKKGQFIRFIGEDIKANKCVLQKGTQITSKEIAVLASCGKSEVPVYAPLKVGVLTTGDELVDISEKLDNDKIRATNLYTLLSLIYEMKMVPVNFGIVKDNKKALYDKLQEALNSDIDILITTGGVSVGEYDFLKEVMSESGTVTKFWKANIKPGKPITFGIYDKMDRSKYLFGLPGNPVSAFVNFNVFIKPAVNNLYGMEPFDVIKAELVNDVFKSDGKMHFLRGHYSFNGSKNSYMVETAVSQSSGNIMIRVKSSTL